MDKPHARPHPSYCGDAAVPARRLKGRHACQRPPRQHGVALILVLLTVAIIAMLATEVSGLIQFDLRLAQNRFQHQQAYWYALGGERLARRILDEDLGTGASANLQQGWANPNLQYPFDGGGASLSIRDQQACFNINALTSLKTPITSGPTPLLQRQFETLFALVDIDPQQVQPLNEVLRDWLDSDSQPSGFDGVEDLHYSGQTPAYQPLNSTVAERSELGLLQGFEPAIRQQLAPFLCALPDDKLLLNINTLSEAQAALLSALFEGNLPLSDAELLIQQRPAEGYSDVDAFWALLPPAISTANPASDDIKKQLSVQSRFFIATTAVTFYDSRFILNSRLRLDQGHFRAYQRYYGTSHD